MVVNEAMACRRPCIVSDRVGCGPDLVLPDETGVVFPHCNVPALAASMVKLARNPSQIAVMGENAHNRLRNYSVGAAVEGVLQSLAATLVRRRLHALTDSTSGTAETHAHRGSRCAAAGHRIFCVHQFL